MRIEVVSYQRPEPEGTSAGRALWAWCTGILSGGHELHVWSWHPVAPDPLPNWCTWRPLPPEPVLRTRARALLRPRADIVRAGWRPPEGAVVVAVDVPSCAAVLGSRRSALTLHYLTRLDARALSRWAPSDIQGARADARATGAVAAVLAYSPRVAQASGARGAAFVPIAYPVPERAVDTVEAPVSVLLADWAWPANRRALRTLRSVWPEVRSRVPGARLVVAGRNLPGNEIGRASGVEAIGPVSTAVDVLAGAAVVVFPCPDTSGPKVKVLEALAHGVPVVTTPAGMEGLVGAGAGAAVAPLGRFADALVSALLDPARRSVMGRAGREAILAHHSPEAAARARIGVLGPLAE
ncbi:MAG: glycosyltransferase family 4 protein [Acidimicrobiales bacterium]